MGKAGGGGAGPLFLLLPIRGDSEGDSPGEGERDGELSREYSEPQEYERRNPETDREGKGDLSMAVGLV